MSSTTPPARPAAPRSAAASEPSLTEREMQVLRRMATGQSNGEIGRDLYLSEDTIKTHCRRIYSKLEVPDRAAAVFQGCVRGLLAPELRDALAPLATPSSPEPAATPSVTLRPCPDDAARLAKVMWPGARGAGADAAYARSLSGLQVLAGTATA